MTQPNLLNPLNVEIRQLDGDDTVFDDRDVGGVIVWQTPFRIPAQIYFGKEEYLSTATAVPDPRSAGGNLPVSDGHIVVRTYDLQQLGKVIKTTDRIISYGDGQVRRECEYTIVGMKEGAQYLDKGQCTLQKFFFKEHDG